MPSQYIEFKSKKANPQLKGVDDITPEELHHQRKAVTIIDVRRPDEWVGEYGHIVEAQLMTLDTLPQRIEELPKDRTIVFICRSGSRSAQATAFAKSYGFESVYNLKGGMIAWTANGFETAEKNGG